MNKPKLTHFLLGIMIVIVANPAFSAFQFSSSDVTVNLNGRLLTDIAWYSHDDNIVMGDGTQIRSFRLGARGQLCPICHYNVSVDFGRSTTSLIDLVLSFEPTKNLRLHIGHYKPPISIEFIDSNLFITFLERALPHVFVTSRRVGIGLDYLYPINESTSITYSAGGFTESPNNVPSPATDQAYNFSNRLNVNQLIQENEYWLTGASYSYTRTDSANTMRYAARPESSVTSVRLVDTGTMTDVKSASLINFELALQYHRLSLQSEYFYNYVNRETLDSLQMDGYYAYASFFLTDDFRPLNSRASRHGRVNPKCRWGALETGLRYSYVTLNHNDIRGGHEGNITFGVNWYLNNYIRFMANYIHASAHQSNQNIKSNIFTLRGQFDFA